MKTTQAKKIQIVHALLSKMKLLHMKEDIINSYGVASTKDLTLDQLDQLINQLNLQYKEKDAEIKKEVDPVVRKWRSVNIDLLSRLGIYINQNSWNRVNEFLLMPKIAGKELYKMNIEELKNLATKLRSILHKREKRLEEEDRQAFYN